MIRSTFLDLFYVRLVGYTNAFPLRLVNVSIPTSIEHLKAKAPAFKEGGLTLTVIASLKLLLYDHDTFSAAVLAKMSPDLSADKAEEGNQAVANIHNAIEGGIRFFETALLTK
jgi:hypothetical protein